MSLTLHLRTRVQPFRGRDEWEEVVLLRPFAPDRLALLICDMWEVHWCRSATRRCEGIAHRMAPVVETARARGVQIIHAPSDCMEFYRDTPQRRLMLEIPPAEPPPPLEISEPPLPIDDSDGGCDDQPACEKGHPWTRQHPAISIAEGDGISDRGVEVYSLLRARGIDTLLIMGVHTNMCVLGRSFAIRQMTRWGMRCVLVRDLTDSMYNPRRSPFVSHGEGTELVIAHIEKHWCPSIQSEDLLRKRQD